MKTHNSRFTITRLGLAIFSLCFLAVLSGCGLDDINLSQYKVQGIDSVQYVGTTDAPPATSQGKPVLPATITVTFKTAPSGNLPVYLNGAAIGDKFTVGATSATLNTSDIKDLLKQGVNLLLVDPMSLGPRVNFIFDNSGPLVDVTKAEEVSGAKNVTVRVDDSSAVSAITITPMNYQWDGATDSATGFKISSQSDAGSPISFTNNGNGTWTASSSVTDSSMYKIVASDVNGYVTTNYYLKPDQKINDVFKLRMNKEVLDNAVPLMQSKIRGMYLYAPEALSIYGKSNPSLLYPSDPDSPYNPKASQVLDSMSAFWKSSAIFYSDMGAKTTNVNDCGYLDTAKFATTDEGGGKFGYAEGPYFQCTAWATDHDGGNNCTAGSWQNLNAVANKTGECSRIVLWRLRLFDVQNMSFTLDDSAKGLLNLNMDMEPLTNPAPPDGSSDALQTDLGIRNIACGTRTYQFVKDSDWSGGVFGCGTWGTCKKTTGYYYDHYCYDNGGVMAIAVIGPNIGDMKVTASSGNPSGGVKVLITNGAMNFDLPNMKLNLGGLAIGSGFDAFIGALSNVLDGLFVNIVKGVIQQNLQEFVLGFDLFTQWDQTNPPKPSMQMQSQAYQTYTNADNNSTTKLEWLMQYAGFLKTVQANLAYVDNNDPDAVHDVLGSRYSINPVISPVDTGSVIDLAINMNIINQALMSFYLSGVSHITVTNLKVDGHPLVHFGPHVSDTFPAQTGDQRVELIPRTPGVLEMANGTNGTKATLYYRNAKMYIETYQGNWASDGKAGWKKNFTVEVDLRLGVLMTALDHKFQMKILGTPDLEINTIKIGDGTGSGYLYNKNNLNVSLGENVVKGLVQTGVNFILNYAVPQIAAKVAELDYPAVHIPATANGMHITTEKIEANNNAHLNFGLGMETVPCTLSSENQQKVDDDPNAIVTCEKADTP